MNGGRQDERPVLDTEAARAGSTPHMTRYILPASLVIVVVAFLIVLALGFY
jgi:hypothetical protein